MSAQNDELNRKRDRRNEFKFCPAYKRVSKVFLFSQTFGPKFI